MNLPAWLSEQDIQPICNSGMPVSPPKVLVTTPYFKPSSGGAQEYCYQIARGLQATKNWKVVIVTSGYKDEITTENYEGLKVHRLPYRLKVSNTPFGLGWHRALKHIMTSENPDIIVAHAPVPGMLEVTARLVKGKPFVVTYHGGSMVKDSLWPDLLIRCYESVFLPRALRKAHKIVCCSAFVKRSPLMAQFAEKCIVIHPGVDAHFFVPGPNKVAGYNIMHVGGLRTGEEYRALETSLRVTAELKEKYPHVHLAVVGDGDKRLDYEEIAQRLGITQHVEFCGRLAGRALVSAYQTADVLITPTRKESFGMVIVEAMACGVPPVASAVEGIPDIVHDGEFGFLVEPGDIASFAEKISELFNDIAVVERFARKARSVAAAPEYSWPCQVQLTANLLESLL